MKMISALAFAVLLAHGGWAQAPSSAPPASGSELVQEGPPGFGWILAYDLLKGVYEGYKVTGNISDIPQVPVAWQDPIYYLGCTTVPQNGASVGSGTIVLHPKLPIGSTVDQIASAGNALVLPTYTALFKAANQFSGDRQLFTATYPSANQGVGVAQYQKTVLGLNIYGSTPADIGVHYQCYIGVSTASLDSPPAVEAVGGSSSG